MDGVLGLFGRNSAVDRSTPDPVQVSIGSISINQRNSSCTTSNYSWAAKMIGIAFVCCLGGGGVEKEEDRPQECFRKLLRHQNIYPVE